MRILFIGSGAFAVPTLQWLARSQHEMPLVVTQPARPSGRGRRTTRTPVAAVADELGLETLDAHDINEPGVVERLRDLQARLGVVIAFGQKLGPHVLAAMSDGCVNLHASLLPKYRGAAPINWAIIRGERQTGCTVFRVVERMDAGPILATRRTDIRPSETAGELHDRLADLGVTAVQDALALHESDSVPAGIPQNEAEATYAPKLKKSDGYVRFDRPATQVVNHVRGMTPWPGAAVRLQAADGRWERVSLIRARAVHDSSRPSLPPGVLDERLYVATADGFVELLDLQPSSGRIMTWTDYVNGRHLQPGDRLLTPAT